MRCARRVISVAARRVKVSRRIRSGRTPRKIKCATRCAKVVVLPVPAPAMIRRGPGMSVSGLSPRPYSTAARWAQLRLRKYVRESTGRLGMYVPLLFQDSRDGMAVHELSRNSGNSMGIGEFSDGAPPFARPNPAGSGQTDLYLRERAPVNVDKNRLFPGLRAPAKRSRRAG